MEKMKEFGYEFINEEWDVVFEVFKKLVDCKKEIIEEDLCVFMFGEVVFVV